LAALTVVVSITGCDVMACQTAKTDQTKWAVKIVSRFFVVVAVVVVAVVAVVDIGVVQGT
jgi:hypothetical protein